MKMIVALRKCLCTKKVFAVNVRHILMCCFSKHSHHKHTTYIRTPHTHTTTRAITHITQIHIHTAHTHSTHTHTHTTHSTHSTHTRHTTHHLLLTSITPHRKVGKRSHQRMTNDVIGFGVLIVLRHVTIHVSTTPKEDQPVASQCIQRKGNCTL